MSTARAADEDNNNTNESAGSGGGGGVDTTLLLGRHTSSRPYLRWAPSLRGAAHFLRRAMSRRMIREPSRRVREAAAERIEERRSDLAYSKPVVVLDLIWNIVFVAVSISMLIISRNERPSMPLRLWVVGYVLLCLLHVACMCLEYRKRRQQRDPMGDSSSRSGGGSSSHNGSGRWNGSDRRQNDEKTSVAKHLDCANTMVLLIWWIMGIYWVSAGGPSLTQGSPQLYRLCITILALDVFFVFIWVAVACVVRIAVRCCLPCVIAILHAVTDQEGATREDIERLPKYKFQRFGDPEKQNGEIQESLGGKMTECDTATPTERVLPLEDSECCICLCTYDGGTELCELPCRHHFCRACIDRWLSISATCPLCKLNILKNGYLSGNKEA